VIDSSCLARHLRGDGKGRSSRTTISMYLCTSMRWEWGTLEEICAVVVFPELLVSMLQDIHA
jgi:hypothetical protein